MTPARWPDTFVVGAPRCGTTAMYHYLAQHPDVFMCPKREPLFFATDLPWLPGAVIRDEDAYLALFNAATSERRIAEVSPFYIYSRLAPAVIRARAPDARVVIMLRNPPDMMYSLYAVWSYSGIDPMPTFEAALAAEPDRRRAQPGAGALFYRDLGRFADRVRHYFDVFGRERVHIVLFDDLTSQPAPTYEATCRFLDVDASFRPDFAIGTLERGASRRPRIPALARLVTTPPPALRPLMRGRLGTRIRDAVRRWATTAPPPMPRDVRRRLQQECADDVAALGRLIGRDLGHWLDR